MITDEAEREKLGLKWGGLKAWDMRTDKSIAALRAYFDAGEQCMSAAMQRNNDAQKKALCNLVDATNAQIYNDWTGEKMTKAEAKDYILNFGKTKETQ